MISLSTIGTYFIGLILLIIVLKILTFPMKLIFKFVFNSIIGGIILAICASFGILINIEWWTVVLTGLFGVPGLVCSVLITFIL